MPPAISEFDLQRALCIWLDGHPNAAPAILPDVVYWHTPNGGTRRDAFEGKRLKQIGLKAGVPDLLFLRGGRLFGLEMKKPGGQRSGVQNVMHARFIAAGATVATCDNLPDAKRQLFLWGLVRLPG